MGLGLGLGLGLGFGLGLGVNIRARVMASVLYVITPMKMYIGFGSRVRVSV